MGKCEQWEDKLLDAEGKDPLELANVYKYRALAYKGKGSFREAIINFENCVLIKTKYSKENELEMAEVYKEFGTCQSQMKNSRASEKHYRKCIEILEKNGKKNEKIYAEAMTNLGITLGLIGKYTEQYTVYKTAMATIESLPNGKDLP